MLSSIWWRLFVTEALFDHKFALDLMRTWQMQWLSTPLSHYGDTDQQNLSIEVFLEHDWCVFYSYQWLMCSVGVWWSEWVKCFRIKQKRAFLLNIKRKITQWCDRKVFLFRFVFLGAYPRSDAKNGVWSRKQPAGWPLRLRDKHSSLRLQHECQWHHHSCD